MRGFVNHAGGWAVAALLLTTSCGLVEPADAPMSSPGDQVFFVGEREMIVHASSSEARTRLFEEARAQQAGVLRLHVRIEDGEVVFGSPWRRFLSDAHQQGLRVEALFGGPDVEIRRGFLSTEVDAIATFNASSGPTEVFSGVHLDLQPYLQHEWKSPARRQKLLETFLQGIEALSARATRANLNISVDVPLWWDRSDPLAEGRAIADVFFKGETKPASYHAAALVDSVGLMNFRNVASTSEVLDEDNGLIGHGIRFLEAVDNPNVHMRVQVGTASQATSYWFAPSDVARDEFLALVFARIDPLVPQQIEGCQTALLDEAEALRQAPDHQPRIHVGIELGSCTSAQANAVKAKISAEFGANSDTFSGLPSSVVLARSSQIQAINIINEQPLPWRNDWWSDAQSANDRHFGFVVARNIPDNLTFDTNREDMMAEIDKAHEAFQAYNNYRGMAFDRFEGLVTVLERPKSFFPKRLQEREDAVDDGSDTAQRTDDDLRWAALGNQR